MVSTVSATMRGFLMPFARHFRGLGWRVDGLARGATRCAECRDGFDQAWDIDWARNPLAGLRLPRAMARVRAVVEEQRYDLVHVHTPIAAFATRLALGRRRRDLGFSVIYTAHGFHFRTGAPPIRSAMYRACERIAGRWTDYLVVINREDEEAARRYRIVPDARIRYVPGIGVDLTRYAPEAVADERARARRDELGLGARDQLFLAAGEFTRNKRQIDALRAFVALGRRDTYLAFAGEGPLLDRVRRAAARLGVGDRVRFLGWRADCPELMRASAAVLLTSAREGLPRSVMEALGLGVPVIGTDTRGTRELLDDGAGLLVEVGDVAGLSVAMGWVLDHPAEARAMAAHGRTRMGRYEIGRILRDHERLYESALQAG
ncbi:MAG: glycosyltransferase [Candidatus Rokuibacteriota bacterium]